MLATLLVVLAYLGGAIPFGVLFARSAGVDVRQTGSGNIGATNVARSAGARLGLLTLFADIGKGVVPVLIARGLSAEPALAAAAGLAAFIGHVYPPLRAGGGKGVATALGVHAALCPPAALAALVVFGATVATCRFVSVASLLGALTAPAAAGLVGAPLPVIGASLTMAFVVLVRHRENLRRLRAGTEPRFALHKRQAAPTE